jgi:hypothetical protein
LEEAESNQSDGGAPKNVGLKKTEAKTEATTEGATELTSESESEEEEDSQARNQDDNASSTSEGEVEIIAKDDEEKGGVPDNNMDVNVDKGKDNNERVTGEPTIYNIFCYFLTLKKFLLTSCFQTFKIQTLLLANCSRLLQLSREEGQLLLANIFQQKYTYKISGHRLQRNPLWNTVRTSVCLLS